jgi:hypothetical protein
MRWCFHRVFVGRAWTGGPPLLLRLLTRLSGQLSLLSGVMVVLFWHGLSGVKL